MPLVCAMGGFWPERVFRAVPGEDNGRVVVSETASMSTGIASRYASAIFDLAKDGKALATLEKDIDALDAALDASADLRSMIASPLILREDQEKAIEAIAAKMGLSALTKNSLGLMATKRRLFVLPQLIAELRQLVATEKGEVTAEVVSATPLTTEQTASLIATLTKRVGKDVKLKATVDESLIGGLVVKLGSMMIDTSIRAKLAGLKNAMKEVG
jgi:F-type H+-transporting ATPase subunit delta